MSDAAADREADGQACGREVAEAVAKTLAGDTSAYDALIERYQRRAVAVSYRLLGNVEDAKDVCQDAFLKAFRSLDSLQQPERFGAWLMRIVSNLSLNYRRGRRSHLSLATDDEGGVNRDADADRRIRRPEEAPNSSLQSAETERTIGVAVEALPEQQRLALILFAIERIPQKEVAEILECSVEMVKWNVFQARKTLRNSLEELLQD